MQAEPGAKLEVDFIIGIEEKISKVQKKPNLAKSLKTIKG